MSQETNNGDIYIPDQCPVPEALSRTTHLAIAAHQDDIEIIGFNGIAQCYQQTDHWFSGIVLTDGAGSPRSGPYQHYSNDEMAAIRKHEQEQAASIGQYSLVLQYGMASDDLKGGVNPDVVEQLAQRLKQMQPQVVYLHNLADRHETHIAVSVHALQALRTLPADKRPQQVLGVEVWRDLDWLPQQYRIELDVSEHRELYAQLMRVFDSQISGKRYDMASQARHLANATFGYSHKVDTCQYVSLAMDLMPLLDNPRLSYRDFIDALLQEFAANLTSCIAPYHVSEEN